MYSYIIIDDESLIRRGTLKKLEPLNETACCIGEAENGKEGLALISELSPDIVILDMQMPVLDGTSLLAMLSEQYPDMPLIVISGHRNFDYINRAIKAHAIDYVLKPFSREEIQKAMLSAIEKIENKQSMQSLIEAEEESEQHSYEYDIQMLQNLILGYQNTAGSVTSRKLSFISDANKLLLIGLHADCTVNTSDMQRQLDEHDFEEIALVLPHPSNTQLAFIIVFAPEDISLSEHRLIETVMGIVKQTSDGEEMTLTLGISNTHSSLIDLHDAYKEASDALNNRLLSASGSRYYYYDTARDARLVAWERQDEFLFRVEAGMEDAITDLLDDLFSLYRRQKQGILADIKYHCYQLGDQCRMIMNDYLNSSASASQNSVSMQNIVSQIFSADELKAYYLRFFLNIAGMLKQQSVYAIDDTVEKIQIYIKRNYQKNLTQEFISSLFYLNRSYLSHVFKEKTGQKFVDYLNEIRIGKAKELLSGSERKMYQVAKAVGYDNPKYFFRIFKKTTGQTPDQYRKKND